MNLTESAIYCIFKIELFSSSLTDSISHFLYLFLVFVIQLHTYDPLQQPPLMRSQNMETAWICALLESLQLWFSESLSTTTQGNVTCKVLDMGCAAGKIETHMDIQFHSWVTKEL